MVVQMARNLPAMQETQVPSPDWEDPLAKGSLLPTPVLLPEELPWTEEPGGLQSMGPQGVRPS